MWKQRIFRFGTGCGIEIRGDDLRVVAVKSRPAGVSVLGETVLAGFRERPPHEWGGEYADFLGSLGLSHLAATVSLPRGEVIVRQIQLPPASRKELAAAVSYQLDTLHPFGEDEVYSALVPLADKSAAAGQVPVGVVIAERAKVDAYAGLFESAGIAVQAFTVTAAAFYAALRVRWDSPPVPFVIADCRGPRLEIYGEGKARPVLSVEFNTGNQPVGKALQLAGGEMRLQGGETAPLVVCGDGNSLEAEGSALADQTEAANFTPFAAAELFPVPLSAPEGFDLGRDGVAFSVALESACPRLGWRANLLPAERRKASSRWMYAPTAALAAALVLLGLAFVLRPLIQDRNYSRALQEETARLAQLAMQVNQTKAKSDEAKQRADLLRSLKQRGQADLRILSELSALIPDSAWVNSLELNDQGVQISGEAAAAAPLLGALNQSRWLTNAAFATSLVRTETGERFQITAQRRAIEPGELEPAPLAAASPLAEEAAVSAAENPAQLALGEEH